LRASATCRDFSLSREKLAGVECETPKTDGN
jgi:hypothetical protein